MKERANDVLGKPEELKKMFDSPEFQAMLADPNFLKKSVEANPELQKDMESNPMLKQAMSNPDGLKKAMEAMQASHPDPVTAVPLIREDEVTRVTQEGRGSKFASKKAAE